MAELLFVVTLSNAPIALLLFGALTTCLPDRTLDTTIRCEAGKCECVQGHGNCDGDPSNGCEIDLLSSNQHCNFCGTPCAGTCVGGICDLHIADCITGIKVDCDLRKTNGCETDISHDVKHCGQCSNSCPKDIPCRDFFCTLCVNGRADCDGDGTGRDANGCERDATNDRQHCGQCGKSCGFNKICALGSCI